jgi:uridine phosphorylase
VAISLDHLHDSQGRLPSPPGDVADMQTAALFEAASTRDVALAAVLIVSEQRGVEPLDDEQLQEAAKRAGRAASALLSS